MMPTTTTTVIGTISLTALCGCGSDCPDCCGVTNCCCGATVIPSVLHATVAPDFGGPPCASADITLTYDSGNARWAGNGTVICGTATMGTPACSFSITVYLRLSCNPGSCMWLLEASCDNFATETSAAVTLVSCSPFLSNAAGEVMNMLACNPCADATFQITLSA